MNKLHHPTLPQETLILSAYCQTDEGNPSGIA